ncbi:MAG: tetratricopeptide repeat protein [Deltaproteobacteria bacterium]|nr:tetratricopeptide repeat protein [Deltaproteobacteria bacterium]
MTDSDAGVGRYVGLASDVDQTIAFDPELGREVVLERSDAVDPARLAALRHRARALATVVHPVVARVHDVVVEHGVAHVVTERVVGEPLLQWLATQPSVPRRRALLQAIAAGLGAIHAAGVAHGSVDADAVCVAQGGAPRLTGLLRVSEGANAIADRQRFCELALRVLDEERPGTRAAVGLRLLVLLRRGRDDRDGPGLAELEQALAVRGGGRRWLGLAAASAVAAVIALGVGDRRSALAGGWCEEVERQVDALWGPQAHAELHEAIAASHASFALEAGGRVERDLDVFVSQWRDAQRDYCAADANPGAAVCLLRQLDGVRAIVDVLREADVESLARGSEAVEALGAPAACLRADAPAAVMLADESVRGDLAASQLLRELGRHVDAQLAAERAIAAATAQGDDAVLAQAELELALALWAQGRERESERILHDAFTHALAAGHDETVARAATELAVASCRRARLAECELWRDHAAAALARVSDPRLRARLSVVDGRAALERGDYPAAERGYIHALELASALEPRDLPAELHARQGVALAKGRSGDLVGALALLRTNVEQTANRFGTHHPDYGRQLNSVATQLAALGRANEAVAARTEALAVLEAALGPAHPDVLAAKGALATDLGLVERDAEGIALLRDVVEQAEQRYDPDDVRIAAHLAELGMAEATGDRLADAIDHLGRAVEQAERALGPDHLEVLGMLNNLAATLMFADRNLEARAMFERVIAGTERAVGREHPQLVPGLLGLARTAVATGDLDGAIAALERALQLLERHEDRADRRGLVASELAQLLWQRDGDNPRSLALMRAAHQSFVSAVGQGALSSRDQAEAAQAWLEAHGGG